MRGGGVLSTDLRSPDGLRSLEGLVDNGILNPILRKVPRVIPGISDSFIVAASVVEEQMRL